MRRPIARDDILKGSSMDDDRLIAAAERYTLPSTTAHYRRLREAAAADAAEHQRALAARIAAAYGVRLSDVDPDGAAIAQLVRLLAKDL